jgi:acyl-coenzyme A synthetase/AMP-(fatty) acid ligase
LLDSNADLESQLFRLKYWVSSGEALPLELALRFLNSMPHSVLLNLYGSSEVAADTTYYDTRNCQSLTCVPIGRPIANTHIYLLDRHMQLVPIGVPAELYVGGDGLARGYFNRPELTAEKFVPNPFSSAPGALLYKTGDWARYLPDGNIEYLGRLDHQVKIRGKRIELGEIEAVLIQHPAVRQAVVMVREDIPGDKRLGAFVILHQDQIATDGELQNHARRYLPYYMVPSVFVLLETFPLTPNGKIDRRALSQLPSSPTYAILSSNM